MIMSIGKEEKEKEIMKDGYMSLIDNRKNNCVVLRRHYCLFFNDYAINNYLHVQRIFFSM